eukprot:3230267-Rhodomonas_salina.2
MTLASIASDDVPWLETDLSIDADEKGTMARVNPEVTKDTGIRPANNTTIRYAVSLKDQPHPNGVSLPYRKQQLRWSSDKGAATQHCLFGRGDMAL